MTNFLRLMKITIACASIFFNCSSASLSSFTIIETEQEKNSEKKPMNQFSILPDEISGWKVARDDKIFTRDNIFDYMNGAGEIYLAYDFAKLYVREYSKDQAPSFVVEIYQMASSEDAYGIFTHDTDGEKVAIGTDAIYAMGLLRFWQGTIFSRILAHEETEEIKSVLMTLGRTIAASVQEESEIPPIVHLLPDQGLLQKSIRYFHKPVSLNAHYYLADGNILNLTGSTNVVLARYQTGENKYRVLLIEYPAQVQANDAFQQFVNVYLKKNPEKSKIQVKTENEQYTGARIITRFVILIFEAASPLTLTELSDKIVKKVEEKFNEKIDYN